MAEPQKIESWRVIMLVGLGDVVIGAGLALAGFMGWFGPGTEALLPVGGLVALAGVGMALWAKSKLNAAESRRGDLN